MAEQLQVPELEVIHESLATAADKIREYTASQAETWQRLPWLALQAEGNPGYYSQHQWLYEYGVHRVDGGASGMIGTYVDCADGRLLHMYSKAEFEKEASDNEVLTAWLHNPHGFNANDKLASLIKDATAPHKDFAGKSEVQVRQWRHATAQRLGLLSMFERSQSVESA